MKVCFFNFCNNGDIHVSREFVNKVSRIDGLEVFYWHKNNKEIIKDLNVKHAVLPKNIHQRTPHYKQGGVIYINTWYGAYKDIFHKYSTSYRTIYESVRRGLGTQLGLKVDEIGGPVDFLPTIDYSKYKTQGIDEKLKQIPRPKVLFCNNQCLSGQVPPQVKMNDVLSKISTAFPNVHFIVSNNGPVKSKNVTYAESIINKNGNDLNEISYISRKCDIIINTSSGPGTFAIVKENLQNPQKTFFTIASNKCILYWPVHYFDEIKPHIKCKLEGVHAKNTNEVIKSLSDLLRRTYG